MGHKGSKSDPSYVFGKGTIEVRLKSNQNLSVSSPSPFYPHRSFLPVLVRLFHCYDKILDRNNRKGQRFISAHDFRDFSPSWQAGVEEQSNSYYGSRKQKERECLH
jgi:hypothetical protein